MRHDLFGVAMATCPECEGTGKTYVKVPYTALTRLEDCGFCFGHGFVTKDTFTKDTFKPLNGGMDGR